MKTLFIYRAVIDVHKTGIYPVTELGSIPSPRSKKKRHIKKAIQKYLSAIKEGPAE